MTKRGVGGTTVLALVGMLAAVPLPGQAPPPAAPVRPATTTTATATATMPAPPLPIGTPPEELPTFEVASVKKQAGGSTSMALRSPGGGRITVVNLPLRLILTQAFGIRDTQIVGGASWMTTDRFTINAKAETNLPRDQLLLMLRSLLIERFGLKYHVEQREAQTYVLTAPEGWKPNARIQPVDCAAGGRGEGSPPAGTARPAPPPCGNLSLSNNIITARGLTFASFASLLSSLGGLGQVHDRTNIPGTFNFQIEAGMLLGRSISTLSAGTGGASVLTGATADLLPTLAEGPSVSDAVKDLGLQLVRRNELIDMLVIDSVSPPDED